jgi:hypothetical protein
MYTHRFVLNPPGDFRENHNAEPIRCGEFNGKVLEPCDKLSSLFSAGLLWIVIGSRSCGGDGFIDENV